MKRVNKFYGLMVFSLVLAALLVACGDPTATVPAAKTDAAMAKATTDAAMMAKGSPDAMAKPTTDAMMAKTTDAMANGTPAAMATTDAMMANGTPAAMATTDAMMANGTPAAMATTDAMMAKGTPDAMAKPTGDAMAKPSLLGGDFNNQGAEAVSGKAVLGKTSDGKLVLRFENLKSANGPDLYVYLTKQASPGNTDQIKAGLEVGKLKATTGNLNYELDTTLDLSQYKSVAIYCKSVNVVFGFANLNSLPA